MIPCKQAIIAFLILLISSSSTAAPQLLDRVEIQVNEGVVLKSEIDNMVNTVKANAKISGQALPPDKTLRAQVIDRLIMTRLQLQIANRIGLHIGDLQLDKAIDNIAKEKQITPAYMRQQLEASGISWAQYREQLRQNITINEIQRIQVQRRIQVSPQEVKNLANLIGKQGMKGVEYKIGHILIAVPSSPTNQQLTAARERARHVLQQLQQGADFKQTAIAVSSGPKALEGGIWDYMNINEMPTIFAELLGDAKTNDIIGPVLSGTGFHIIKVMDVRGLQIKEIKEVRSRHILIKPSPILSEDRAKAMLSKFVQQINAGKADFATLARQYSEDPGSAVRGGELGWAQPSIYVPEFANALNSLSVGQISTPFRSVHGWHIVQLEQERKIDATDKFNTNRAHQLIFRRKFNEELQNWMNEIRASAYIKIFDTNAKGG